MIEARVETGKQSQPMILVQSNCTFCGKVLMVREQDKGGFLACKQCRDIMRNGEANKHIEDDNNGQHVDTTMDDNGD
jgi:DNA-directed RNA polymerase subunit M/transcription elongation factor TFIIS